MASIDSGTLLRDFHRAHDWWGQTIDGLEREFGFPPYTLYAVGSRETNLGRHWRSPAPAAWPSNPALAGDLSWFAYHTGDNGHGHGVLQVDDRSHRIPADWAGNLDWQLRGGAQILRDAWDRYGNEIAAYNAYNSGQPQTSRTTGGDYGSDTQWRRLTLLELLGPPAPTRKDDIMAQASIDPGDWELVQFDEVAGRILLFSENVGRWDPAAKPAGAYQTLKGANVRIAVGQDTAGWLWLEELWVPPHRVGRAKPQGVAGGISVINKGPNKVSVTFEPTDVIGMGAVELLSESETRHEISPGEWAPFDGQEPEE